MKRAAPIVIALVALLDQLSKSVIVANLAPGQPLYLVGNWFRFLLVYNPGAAFSFGTGATWVFTCIQIAFLILAAIVIPRIKDSWSVLALALVAGGALGNLIDRLFREPTFFLGHVVDFISVGSFAIFNLADSAITCGVIVFLIASLTEQRRASHRQATDQEVVNEP
ncbi:signal peptidase II [Corynebacterium poyangense]|uniref:Lipoprotein signal peptidase n=1 Tax=Corynebacterium poyangense TaxID=2684405 RepID=A0A7H0SSD9_9CORY|nr:signal peptidase II [Corynebacterium poyangense]MBZ8178131.1 signal peptidase II [Corynebacterium poyangense]QNQ91464.1 signal peptidase II [Corynebacterium poyangense]